MGIFASGSHGHYLAKTDEGNAGIAPDNSSTRIDVDFFTEPCAIEACHRAGAGWRSLRHVSAGSFNFHQHRTATKNELDAATRHGSRGVSPVLVHL
jgi:hypothetical protein